MSKNLNKGVTDQCDYTKRSAVIGETGTGKTFFLERMLLASPIPVLLVDVKYDVVNPQFVDIFEAQVKNPKFVKDLVLRHLTDPKPHKILLRGSIRNTKAQSQVILATLVREYLLQLEDLKIRGTPRQVLICIDEADLFHPKDNSAEPFAREEFEKLFTKGRSLGAIGWLGTQRAAQPHNNMLTQCQQAFVFYQGEADIKLLNKYFSGAKNLEFAYKADPHRFYRYYYLDWSNAKRLSK